jgi:hypothetical protein
VRQEACYGTLVTARLAALALLTLSTALCASSRVEAAPERSVVLLEQVVGRRDTRAAPWLSAVALELGEQVASGAPLGARLEQALGSPVWPGRCGALDEALDLLSRGHAAFIEARLPEAAERLRSGLDRLAARPCLPDLDESARQLRQTAQLELAQAQLKLRQPHEATATVAALLRSAPSYRFSETALPPRLVEVGQRLLHERAATPATLLIETLPDGRRLFVDERPVGSSPQTLAGLLPGPAQLVVEGAAGRPARRRSVALQPGRATSLSLSMPVSDRLETEQFVGLRFDSPERAATESGPLAAAVARALGADEVVVLEVRADELDAHVYGAVDGEERRSATLALTTAPPAESLRRFARLLRGGFSETARPAPVVPRTSLTAAVRPRAEATDSTAERWIGIGSLGGAAVLFAVGAGVHVAGGCERGLPLPAGEACGAGSASRTVSTIGLVLGGAALTVGVIELVVPPLRRRVARP